MAAAASLQEIAQLPLALYDDVVIGLDTLPDIFERHGYRRDLADRYRNDPRFKRIVEDRRDELEKAGVVHATRAASVADSALAVLATRIQDPATPTSVVLDTYKSVSKNAGLEPKTGASMEVQGTGFSITFNIGGGAKKEEPKVVEGETVESGSLGEPPSFLKNVNADLDYDGE